MIASAVLSVPPSSLSREKEENLDRLQVTEETTNIAKLKCLQQLRIIQMMTTVGQVHELQNRYDNFVVNFAHFANGAVAELIYAPAHFRPTLFAFFGGDYLH